MGWTGLETHPTAKSPASGGFTRQLREETGLETRPKVRVTTLGGLAQSLREETGLEPRPTERSTGIPGLLAGLGAVYNARLWIADWAVIQGSFHPFQGP